MGIFFKSKMTELIACLSTGKGTWGHVARLIEEGKWDKVLLITNDFGAEKFNKPENAEFIVVQSRQGMEELVEEIKKQLEGKISGTEVAVNLVSGSGKEHMAILSAIMKLGKGFRLFALTKDGVKEI